MNKCPYIVDNECDIDRCNNFFDKAELLDKVAKRLKSEFPIMENDFGLIVNENVHKEVDKIIADMKAEVAE